MAASLAQAARLNNGAGWAFSRQTELEDEYE
jgi:hypothetical protein